MLKAFSLTDYKDMLQMDLLGVRRRRRRGSLLTLTLGSADWKENTQAKYDQQHRKEAS